MMKTCKTPYITLLLLLITTESSISQQCNDDSGCCSNDFASCIDWCGTSMDECLGCNQGVHWICGEQNNCQKKWDECTQNKDGCCDGLTCVEGNPWYSQCKYVEASPTINPSPTNPPPTNPPSTVSPTSSPQNPPTSSPTSSPQNPPTKSPTSSPTSSPQNCIQCTNAKTPWMENNNKDCPSSSNILNKKCNKNRNWTKKNYCQLSCYNAGIGYPGDICCDDNPPPTPGPTSLAPISQAPVANPTNSPTNTPTTASPVTAQPTTSEPTTVSPTTVSPTTASPTTASPTTASPTTSEPTTAQPTTVSPTTASPVTAQPTTSEPTTVSPTTSINFPTGPYIIASNANERIVIPDPTEPNDEEERSNCPHESTDLLDWDSSSTWENGGLPGSGENVILPFNSRIIIRRSVDVILGVITIPPSSELIFDENGDGITLDVRGIMVLGKLTIGSDTCRIEAPVTITLHGSRPNDAVTNVREPTYKGIDVTDGGVLSLHGKRFFRTWTRLAATAEPGDTIIMLQNKVNWLPGQEIVLVTTAMKDSREWHRNEVAIVQSVIQNPTVPSGEVIGSAVILESPISYQHVANSGYQGEVGLLTRQIVIQGDESTSEPTDPDPLNCKYNSQTSPGTTRYIYGDRHRPCPNTELTGFGGHVIVRNGSKGYVEGVELYRMGQTNVLGRYPMHFHLLDDSCSDCYFRDSSVHRSYYRCISIHGTHYTEVSENVAYDVSGFCYYLEDGVEHHNQISFNLGAHIHLIGPEAPWGNGQTTDKYQQSDTLTLPADVSASAFYITNVQNYIIGNAASGGWAGFAFPILPTPLGTHRDEKLRPSSVTGLTIDGNTAHSSSWWWSHAAAFYWGGSLYYNSNGVLEYNSGRDFNNRRQTCKVNKCIANNNCNSYCQLWEQASLEVTNTKAFLAPGVGFGSWSGNMDITGYECHDCGLSLESLSDGFWVNKLLAVCRTKTPLMVPNNANVKQIPGSGFTWYDTDQAHIITDAVFRNCGYRSNEYDQYNQDVDRGCGNESDIGCTSSSSVWGMLTHADQFVPEMMQGTKDIRFENCGRRFRLVDFRSNNAPSSVSGREQNWYDIDGTITGMGEPSIAASGLTDAGMWWQVDDEVVYDPQAPLWFFKLKTGPERGLGHFRMRWDDSLHNKIGNSQCGNGQGIPCDYVGYIRHLGDYFSGDSGLPVTANADIVGPVGGFGWKLELIKGAPRSVRFEQIEVDPSSPMLLSISYPLGTSFTITAHAVYCTDGNQYSCTETFQQVSSMEEVRNSIGNTYHVDSSTGLLTFRIIQTPSNFVGRPDFFLPSYDDIGKWGNGYALGRFERDGVRLPKMAYGPYLTLEANCSPDASGKYCNGMSPTPEVHVCGSNTGFYQTGYDVCTSTTDPNNKRYANRSSSLNNNMASQFWN